MRRFTQIPVFFFALVVVLTVLKCGFMAAVGGYSAHEMGEVILHGFTMDCSVAGYFTVIPALLTVASVMAKGSILRLSMKIYTIIIALIIALIAVTDAALYPYWGFKLDATPVFYFFTSPGAACASIEWWQWVVCPVAIAGIACGIYFWLRLCSPAFREKALGRPKKIWATAAGLIFLTGALIIPIRGGLTVSVMSPARAYFSTEMRLNHAAINPVFNLIYSLSHSTDFASQFQYFTPEELPGKLNVLQYHPSDSLPRFHGRPDIYLIILEGFSAHLMPSLGGAPVAMRLDSIATGGLSFTQAYASSFRTDRALPAILCGYPGQPTSSILKYIDKVDSLPSMPRILSDAGYDLHYYYGGDFDFANMSALAIASHFKHIVSDKDFPVTQRMSKWGAPDEYVFARAAADMQARRGGAPVLNVIQTSSSHEPYDVPYHSRFVDKKLNAFAYADSCLGAFVKEITTSPGGKNSVFVIVADHYGSWPEGLTDASARHHIPLVFYGEPIERLSIDPSLASRIASQTDIAATVCTLLGLDVSDFPFSNNLLDPARKEYAFVSEPSRYAIITPQGRAVMAVDTHAPLEASPDSLQDLAKAYIQTLYTDLSKR